MPPAGRIDKTKRRGTEQGEEAWIGCRARSSGPGSQRRVTLDESLSLSER